MSDNRKKLLSVLLAMLLALAPFSLQACGNKDAPLTVTYSITSWADVQVALDRANNGDIINLSALWSPATPQSLKIPANLDLVIVGRANVTFYAVAISCEGKNTVTIDNLSIVATNNQALSALHFEGKQNQLIIVGNNTIASLAAEEKAGYGAAIGVPEKSELTITGAGVLNVSSANGAATIGAGSGKSAGSIVVDAAETNFNISYSAGGAGIGGGNKGSGGNIVISNGTFYISTESSQPVFGNILSPATSSGASDTEGSGAGIGGGASGEAGKISINGGEIHVDAFSSAACIGGGSAGGGGEISFAGGYVYAQNLGAGTCLGGASTADAAKLSMTGGAMNLYAPNTAINGVFGSLPSAYLWQTSDMPIMDVSEMRSYPGEPYQGSGTFSFVIVETHAILSVSVDPSNALVSLGGSQVFDARVVATGGANRDVRWSAKGNVSLATQINTDGPLTVAADEPATTLTVVATSITYSDKFGEATVTVIPADN
jgi:hypothetical protein